MRARRKHTTSTLSRGAKNCDCTLLSLCARWWENACIKIPLKHTQLSSIIAAFAEWSRVHVFSSAGICIFCRFYRGQALKRKNEGGGWVFVLFNARNVHGWSNIFWHSPCECEYYEAQGHAVCAGTFTALVRLNQTNNQGMIPERGINRARRRGFAIGTNVHILLLPALFGWGRRPWHEHATWRTNNCRKKWA